MNLGAILHMKVIIIIDKEKCSLAANSLNAQGDYSNARVEYERALKLDPRNTIIRDNIEKLNRSTKRKKE